MALERAASILTNMDKKEIVEIAFQIIGFAGDAYSDFNEAVSHAERGEFDSADEKIKSGKKQLVLAHKAQTKLLVSESRGEDIPYSLTMVHAQDHLMRAALMETLSKHLIAILRKGK